MPTNIERDAVRRLVDEGARLVDVLPAKEYAEAHLPKAAPARSGRPPRETTAPIVSGRCAAATSAAPPMLEPK